MQKEQADNGKKQHAPIHGSTFLKMFFGLVLLSVIPIICTAAILYNQSIQFLQSEDYRSNQRTLEVMVGTIDAKLMQIDQYVSLLANNNLVLSFMLSPSVNEVRRNYTIMESLDNMARNLPAPNSVYVYSHFSGLVLTSSGMGYSLENFYDPEIAELYAQRNARGSFYRRHPEFFGKRQDYITIIKNVPWNSVGDLGGVVLNIEPERLFPGAYEDMVPFGVFDKDNKLLFCSDPIADVTADTLFWEETMNYETTTVHTVNRDQNVLLYAKSAVTGWTYVHVLPLPQFYRQSRSITSTLLLLSGFMLLICLVVSFFVATRLYSPLQKLVGIVSPLRKNIMVGNEYELITNAYNDMVNEKSTITDILNSMRPEVKNNLFMSLLNGEKFSPSELMEKLNFIDEGFSLFGYELLMVNINDFELYDEKSQNLYSYQLMRVLRHAAGQHPHVVVKMDRSQWTLVINVEELDSDRVYYIASDIWDEIAAEKKFSVTVAIGGGYENIADLAQSYKEAQEMMRFKLYRGGGNEFDIPANGLKASRGLMLNTKREDAVIKAIRTGDLALLSEAFKDFAMFMQSGPLQHQDIYVICNHLVESIIGTLVSLGLEVRRLYNRQGFEAKMIFAGSLQEIETYMYDLCVCAATQVEQHNIERGNHNVVRMKEFINDHMCNDISLTDLANHIELSPTYVSRLFKENFGMGFVEYLNSNRIQRAKILLEETQIMVDQVGFEVGFNNVRSFMRAFKQYEGVSPGYYRMEHREKLSANTDKKEIM